MKYFHFENTTGKKHVCILLENIGSSKIRLKLEFSLFLKIIPWFFYLCLCQGRGETHHKFLRRFRIYIKRGFFSPGGVVKHWNNQRSDGTTIPVSAQQTWMWFLWPCFNNHHGGGAKLMVGLEYLKVLFQPWWSYGFMIKRIFFAGFETHLHICSTTGQSWCSKAMGLARPQLLGFSTWISV